MENSKGFTCTSHVLKAWDIPGGKGSKQRGWKDYEEKENNQEHQNKNSQRYKSVGGDDAKETNWIEDRCKKKKRKKQ